ncbi:MAG: dihydrofolate reductase family protein [Bacteroidota bacterium]
MRKVIFQEWLSMDGFAADANNSPSFLESVTLNKYSDQDQLAMMENFDTILLGANTYKLFVDFWPTATTDQEIIADKLNSTPKIVFSKSMAKAPWGKWPDATIINTDAVAALKELKAQAGKDMVLWGSISLAQSFMKANLIDEYHLRICPLVLGAGRPLFESTGPLDFELFGTRQYPSGLMLLQYKQKVK